MKGNKAKHENQIKHLRANIRRRKRFLTNEFHKQQAEKINVNFINHEMKQLFTNATNHDQAFRRGKETKTCSNENIFTYFKHHFNPALPDKTPEEVENTPDYIKQLQQQEVEILEDLPSEGEIKDVIKGLKNDKSSSDISPNVIKEITNSNSTLSETNKLIMSIWETEQPPQSFGKKQLIAIWKRKGNKTDAKNYRAIQVGSIFCKILIILILNRFKEWYESQLLDFQNGFRKGRGTTDGIYVTKMMQHIAHKTNKEIYVLFVDLSSAFDHINREWLFKSIRNRLPEAFKNNKILNILENLYKQTSTEIKDNPTLNFRTTSGVRQGGPESPLLFNLFIDYVLRVFLDKCKKEKVPFAKYDFRILDAARQNRRIHDDYRGTATNEDPDMLTI